MQKIHNINEDYDHYVNRRRKENFLSDLWFIGLLGLGLIVASYFLKSVTFGILGIILVMVWLFFIRGEFSHEEREKINKWYPLGLIIVALLVAYFKYTMLQFPDDGSANKLFDFMDLVIGGLFWWAIIVICIRLFKKLKKKGKFNSR